MAIERGYKVMANDITNTLDAIDKAYKKVKGKHRYYTWEHKPIYGNLITAELIKEIYNVGIDCLGNVYGSGCSSNYDSKGSNYTAAECNVEINQVKNYGQ